MARLTSHRFSSLLILVALLALLGGVDGCSARSALRVSAAPNPSVTGTATAALPPATGTTTADAPPVAASEAPASPTPEPSPTSTPTAVPTATPTRRTVVYAPILMYHSFDETSDLYSVRPSRFREQLRALKKAGFAGVTLDQIADALDKGTALPEHPIAITLDDARASQKIGLQILAEEGFTATLFVPSGWHELSRDFIVGLDRQGYPVESHTVWHANLVRTPNKRHEIREGKLALEEWLGHPVAGFAYPYGAYRPADVAEVRRLGFRYAVTIRHGVALRADERYRWPRLLISNDDPDGLVKRLNGMLEEARAGKEPPAPEQFG